MSDSDIGRIRALIAANPRPPELAERRRRLALLGEQSGVSTGVVVQPVDARGVTAEWTTAPGADETRALLYLHGGGYISGSLASHRALVAEAGLAARVRTLALAYRLAPEHPYPAALEDALQGYRFLLDCGLEARHIVVGGDSAGGGLAIALLLSLRAAGEALPAGAWCISPWVDLEMTGASMAGKATADPLISKPYLQELAAAYLAGTNPREPLASPLYADLRGLPPFLIQVGSAETLLDDALRLAGAAAAADVAVTLETYPEMIHVWHLFFRQVAAGRRAIGAAGRFIAERTR